MAVSYDRVFHRVAVDYLVEGGARITWELQPFFWEPGPYRFQLQVGETGNPVADDWVDVGSEIVDALYGVDDEARTRTKWQFPHYRVRLTTDQASYYSVPEPAAGRLTHRDWCTARAVVRRERQHQRLSGAWKGVFLRRKWKGVTPPTSEPLTAVTDYLTGEVIDTQQTVTYGTPFEGGYYTPTPFTLELDDGARYIENDTQLAGTSSQLMVRGRALAIPEVQHQDLFVHTGSDKRFEVHEVVPLASPWGFPLVVNVSLRLLPASDIAYQVPLT